MRRLSGLITSFALVGGSLLWSAGAAQAVSATTASGTATAGTEAAKAYVRVTYPTAMRRGGSATFGYKASRLRSLDSDGLVLVAYLPKGTASKVRFLTRPAHSTCGFRGFKVYCVVRLTGADTTSMRFRLSVKYKYAGKYSVDHYARAVNFESGLSARDYVDEVTSADRVGRSRTIISRT